MVQILITGARHSRCALVLFAMGALTACGGLGRHAAAEGCSLESVSAYLVEWNVMTNVRSGYEEVKRSADVRAKIIRLELTQSLLRELRTRAGREPCPDGRCSDNELRFVAEFVGPDGCEAKFAASDAFVYDLSARTRGPNDTRLIRRLHCFACGDVDGR